MTRSRVDRHRGGSCLPTPATPPPAPARLRTHPQLRLPRQPVPRCPPAALLPPAPRHWTAPTNRGSADFTHTRSALELPCLRRNHARRRTPLRSSTPASLSSAVPRVCRMNPQFQPRPAYLLRHAQSPCVASRSNRTQDHASPAVCYLIQKLASANSSHIPYTHHAPPTSDTLGLRAASFKFHSKPTASGFLQVAVSEAPSQRFNQTN
jgi:hypothetical protein